MAVQPVSSLLTSQGVRIYQWAAAAEGDTFAVVNLAGHRNALMEIEITGTFGGATVGLEGSFDPDEAAPATPLINNAGDVIAATEAAFVLSGVNPTVIRPTITGGSSAAVVVRVMVRGD